MNYAKNDNKDAWYRHPVSGDASFDSFVRMSCNPIHQGSHPFLWPVNGTLFNDPKSNKIYLYVSCYFEGYWPKGEQSRNIHIKGYCSNDMMKTWEPLGIILEGKRDLYGSTDNYPGVAADLHMTYDNDSDTYYGLIGFTDYNNQTGGVACVYAKTPFGPFNYAEEPIYSDKNMPLFEKYYHRVYACSIIKRKKDWLIVGMCSTPRNAGGSWSFCYMTSQYPDRNYSSPKLLFSPQDKLFFPNIIEFFPAFSDHNGMLYCTFTSVSANRNFQVIYKVDPENAEDKSAWELFKYGSIWHNELATHEKNGIWGQALAGMLLNNRLFVMYPALSDKGVGTINLAYANFENLQGEDRMVLSAAVAQSMTFVRRSYSDFCLTCSMQLEGEGAVLFWGFDEKMEYTSIAANAKILPNLLCNTNQIVFEKGKIYFKSPHAKPRFLEDMPKEGNITFRLVNSQKGVYYNNIKLTESPAQQGMMGILANPYSKVTVDLFELDGHTRDCWLKLGITDGLMGAGMGYVLEGKSNHDWVKSHDQRYYSNNEGAILKYNYYGKNAKLHYYQGGSFEIYLDGDLVQRVNATKAGYYLIETENLGYHAVFIKAKSQGVSISFIEIQLV